MSTKQKILITAALPYANGAIHFGHLAGAYLPADCFARFNRLLGHEVCFICGSDEYGVAISLSASLAGRTPQEHVNHFHEVNKKLFQKMQMSFDHYSRTTWPGHDETVLQFFYDLSEKGYLEEIEGERLFCEEDGMFYADRYVVGQCPICGFLEARGDECTSCGASYEAEELKNPRTKIGNKSLTLKKTWHWYLRLDLFKEKLLSWLSTKPWKSHVVNFVRKYIEEVRPRAITRDMKWGIPVPNAEGKVFYVWFDAPIGYISATKEYAEDIGQKDRWKDFWLDSQTKLVQFVGKDNVPFHGAIFPAMLMGQKMPYKLVDDLVANEFYTLSGKQFSKSDGWYVDLADFLSKYTPDQLRYAIASNAPETQDSEFTWKDFQSRCNADLLSKLGNFVNRVLVFAKNKCDQIVPQISKLSEEDQLFLERCREIVSGAKAAYASYRLRKASSYIMELAQVGNIYFDSCKPWQKDLPQEKVANTIFCCLQTIKMIALISFPIIPSTALSILSQIGLEEEFMHRTWDEQMAYVLPSNHRLGTPAPLFKKIEDEQIAEEEKVLFSKK